MIRFLKRMPIKRQLIFLAGSTGTIVFSLIMLIYLQISNVITNNNREFTNQLIQQINGSITSKCKLMNRVLTNVAYNNIIQNYLMEEDPYKKVLIGKDVDNIMMNMSDLHEGILNIFFINNTGAGYYLRGKRNSVVKVINSIPKNLNNYYTGVEKIEYENSSQECFIITTPVYSINNEKNYRSNIGIAALVLDARVLGLETENRIHAQNSTSFYLADREKNVYSSNTEDTSLYEKFPEYSGYEAGNYIAEKDGEKYFIAIDKIPQIGGRIVSITPEKLLLSGVSWIRKLTYIILLAAAALLSVPFFLIINNISHPLKRLLSFIYSIKNGDLKLLKKRLTLEGFEEIEIVAVEFNNMLDEIDKLTQGLVAKSTMLYEAELAKKQSELAYLKSQINPHFLYNTLEAMKGSAFDEGAERTAGMAKALAAIFRYSVKGENTVSLNDELNIVKSYVQIQQMRFDDKFDVSYEFSNESLACVVPKMLLQPIVENAVFHGLEAKMERGCLRLEGYIDVMRDLVVLVEDDGIGIEEEKVSEMNEQLDNKASKSIHDNTSIGIFNVNNRIKLTYGEKYGIKVYSVLDMGTKVILKLPTGEAAV